MAAPTNLRREESPCQVGAVHTWHLTGIGVSPNVTSIAVFRATLPDDAPMVVARGTDKEDKTAAEENASS